MNSETVFPVDGEWQEAEHADRLEYTGSHGITKRELFAAMAMQGLLSGVYSSKEMLNEFTEAKHSPGNDLFARSYVSGCDAISRNAVSYADALIEALAKEQK